MDEENRPTLPLPFKILQRLHPAKLDLTPLPQRLQGGDDQKDPE
jgi:hypothetical protein